MTTEQATRIIAYTYENGAMNPEQKISLTEKEAQWLSISDAEMEDYYDRHVLPPPMKIQNRCQAMYSQARAWNWGEVEKHILACYKLLGADAPALNHGYAFHRGEHPIQQVISAATAGK